MLDYMAYAFHTHISVGVNCIGLDTLVLAS